MKRFLILLVLCSSLSISAQKKDRHEHIKALKVPFLTEELNLTPAEAEKFWPIYNVYDSKMSDFWCKMCPRRVKQGKCEIFKIN